MRACVGASVQPVLARLKENCWLDCLQNFTSEPSRGVHDLIRFWPYKVKQHGNGERYMLIKMTSLPHSWTMEG